MKKNMAARIIVMLSLSMSFLQHVSHAEGVGSFDRKLASYANERSSNLNLEVTTLSLQSLCQMLKVNESHCKCPELDLYHKSPPVCTTSGLNAENCVKETVSKARVILITIISILGILGNFHVILVRTTFWNPCPHYQLIVGLSIADLLFSIVCLVDILGELLSPCVWMYSVSLCKVLQSLLTLSAHIDLGFILVISVERFMGIVYPFSERFTKLRTRQMIAVNVFVGVCLVIPYFVHFNISSDGVCQLLWSTEIQRVYSWCVLVLFFLTPVSITSLLSYKSVQALQKTMCEHGMLSAMDERSRSRLVAENKKIMRVLIVLLMAFVLLVLPNNAVWVVLVTVKPESTSLHGILKMVGTVPYSLHVTVNPIIYSVLDKRFRKYSLDILRCRVRKGDKEYESYTRSRVLTHEDGDVTTSV